MVAQLAKELGILTVAVVTRPFDMEGGKRHRAADAGIAELSKYVDSLITIPNQKLLTVLGGSTTLLDAFKRLKARGRRARQHRPELPEETLVPL